MKQRSLKIKFSRPQSLRWAVKRFEQCEDENDARLSRASHTSVRGMLTVHRTLCLPKALQDDLILRLESYAAWGSRQSRHDTVLLSEPRGRRSGGLVEFVIDAHRPDSPVSSCVIWMERCKVLRVAYTVNKGLPGLKEDIRGVMSRKRPSVGFLTNTDEMAATHIELIFSS